MKLHFLLILLFFAHTAHTQVKDGNKTRQIEQLQQLKETITRKIDTLHFQLMGQADSIEGLRKKLDQLKRENNNQDKPDMASKEQASKLSQELVNMTNTAYNLQKKYDLALVALDKAVNLQKDLDDKIVLLVRESNQ
jgi:predicted RNase H-like nuclease (RuvC/YqgF family)